MPNANAPRPSRCSMRPRPCARRRPRGCNAWRRKAGGCEARRTARSTIPCRRFAGWPRSLPPRCRTPRARGARRPRTSPAGWPNWRPAPRWRSGTASSSSPAPGRQRLRRSVPAGGDCRTRPQEPRHDCGLRGQQAGRGAVRGDRQAERHAVAVAGRWIVACHRRRLADDGGRNEASSSQALRCHPTALRHS